MERENEFRSYLKKMGKKAHVVDSLVNQVRQFETFAARLPEWVCGG